MAGGRSAPPWDGLRPKRPPAVWVARGITFLCVTVAWVFFRAESVGEATGMLRAMAGLQRLDWRHR